MVIAIQKRRIKDMTRQLALSLQECTEITRASAAYIQRGATYPVHQWSHDLLARKSKRKHHEPAWTRQTAQW